MRKTFTLHALFSCLLLFIAPLSFALDESEGEQSQQQQQIDINTADAQALALALDGVGEAKAQEIVDHREMYGDFKALEELEEVKGIGMATVEKNRHRIKPIVSE